MYESELNALKRSGRLRKRRIFSPDLIDLASNDYLGFAHDERLFDLAVERVRRLGVFGAKASQLVSGYTKIHRDFERFIAKRHSFEAAIAIGSGFLGNLALFETLPRKGDLLLIDREYHASGVLAAKTARAQVEFFAHNSAEDLRAKLSAANAKRVFVAAEGVYSMSGRLVDREIIAAAKQSGAMLILDEAHSGGVVGKRLLGALDFYGFDAANVVRLGTLGKAYGSYGAYILGGAEVVRFLETKAKPIIYSTAPSLFDIAFAHEAAKRIAKRGASIAARIARAKAIAAKFGYETDSLILPIALKSDAQAIGLQKALAKRGFLVGAIRRPTVQTPQLRVILRESAENLKRFFRELKELNG